VIVFPQASVTTGAVGATASDGQFTVLAPLTGNVKSGISTEITCVQVLELPQASVAL
jgi:hypothetical protein